MTPADCDAVVTLLPRNDASNDMLVAGGPSTVVITGRSIVFICQGETAHRRGCSYQILQIAKA